MTRPLCAFTSSYNILVSLAARSPVPGSGSSPISPSGNENCFTPSFMKNGTMRESERLA